MWTAFLATLLLLDSSGRALASEPMVDPSPLLRPGFVWVDGRLGSASVGALFGSVGVNLQVQPTGVLVVRFSDCFEPRGIEPRVPLLDVRSVSVSYGQTKKGRAYHLTATAGPAFVTGVERGRYLYTEVEPDGEDLYHHERRTLRGVGFTAEARAVFTPAPIAGLGLFVQIEANTAASYFALGATVELGSITSWRRAR